MLDKGLIAHISDLRMRCESRNMLTHSEFLTPSEAALLTKDPGMCNSCFLFGGYDEAERVMLFFLPDYLSKESSSVSECITAIRCKAPFSDLTHRDYLGALLSLGIKRSCIGDIMVGSEEAIILLDSKIAGYVIEHLNRIGRGGVSCTVIDLSEIQPPTPRFREITATVASLRADSVFSVAFGISREKVTQLIKESVCMINWLPFDSPSTTVSENDVLSARGFGRAKLITIGGTSKKSRTFITIHHYE